MPDFEIFKVLTILIFTVITKSSSGPLSYPKSISFCSKVSFETKVWTLPAIPKE